MFPPTLKSGGRPGSVTPLVSAAADRGVTIFVRFISMLYGRYGPAGRGRRWLPRRPSLPSARFGRVETQSPAYCLWPTPDSSGHLPGWSVGPRPAFCGPFSSEVASAAPLRTSASTGRPATARAPAPTPNRPSSTTTRTGLGSRHLALGATIAPQMTAASSGAPMPSSHAATPSPTANPRRERGQHRQLAQEPDGQRDPAQPAQGAAARRSASALRWDSTLRIPGPRSRGCSPSARGPAGPPGSPRRYARRVGEEASPAMLSVIPQAATGHNRSASTGRRIRLELQGWHTPGSRGRLGSDSLSLGRRIRDCVAALGTVSNLSARLPHLATGSTTSPPLSRLLSCGVAL
jgi:hypothetical protein